MEDFFGFSKRVLIKQHPFAKTSYLNFAYRKMKLYVNDTKMQAFFYVKEGILSFVFLFSLCYIILLFFSIILYDFVGMSYCQTNYFYLILLFYFLTLDYIVKNVRLIKKKSLIFFCKMLFFVFYAFCILISLIFHDYFFSLKLYKYYNSD